MRPRASVTPLRSNACVRTSRHPRAGVHALHQPGFIVQSIAASDLPDDLVVITTVVATHMSSNIDIESSIETVTTPEVLGVKWDAEQITAVD